MDDPNIGTAFIRKILTDSGLLHHVYNANKWKIAFGDIEDTDIVSN